MWLFEQLITSIIPNKKISKKEREVIEERKYQENKNRWTWCHWCASYALIMFITIAFIVVIVNGIK